MNYNELSNDELHNIEGRLVPFMQSSVMMPAVERQCCSGIVRRLTLIPLWYGDVFDDKISEIVVCSLIKSNKSKSLRWATLNNVKTTINQLY